MRANAITLRNLAHRLADAGAVLLALAAVTFGIWLLVVGQLWTVFENGNRPYEAFEPTALGLAPLASGLLLGVGVLAHHRAISWLGAILLTVSSVLGVFGALSFMLPVAIVSVITLVIHDATRSAGA